jgi:hypothetical protein
VKTCTYPGCAATVDTPGGRGRPPIYCTGHRGKASSKRAVRFARLLASDPCCADAKRANPRVRKCPQHKQWKRFVYDSLKRRGTARDVRKFADMLEAWGVVDAAGRGFRIASNDNYIIESQKDRQQHEWADDFIAANARTPDEGENSPEITGATHEHHPPDDMERKLNIASTAAGLTVREYIAACVIAGMETHSRHDPLLAMVFQEPAPKDIDSHG